MGSAGPECAVRTPALPIDGILGFVVRTHGRLLRHVVEVMTEARCDLFARGQLFFLCGHVGFELPGPPIASGGIKRRNTWSSVCKSRLNRWEGDRLGHSRHAHRI
jgi:hypothetical protein